MELRLLFRKSLLALSIFGAFSGAPQTLASQLSVSAGNGELGQIQSKLYVQAFRSYVSDLTKMAPELKLDGAAIPDPSFDSKLSRNEWIKAYSEWVAAKKQLSEQDTRHLVDTSAEGFQSYYKGEAFARVPFLSSIQLDKTPDKPEVGAVTSIPLIRAYPKPHTLDVEEYVNARFPDSLQKFFSDKQVKFFAHNGSCPDTVAYHYHQGYTEPQRFHGPRDNQESTYLLLRNPKNSSYRFAVCHLVGNDGLTRITKILGPSFKQPTAQFVGHKSEAPLFEFNDEGKRLQLTANDRVIVGFQNTVWWHLAASPKWERVPLTSGGADAAIFRNKETGERIISVWNVYGDEMKEVLKTFYEKGGQRFVYIGTSGGMDPNYKIGDVLLPTQFQQKDGTWLAFDNDGTKMTLGAQGKVRILKKTRQGWIATLIEETTAKMEEIRDSGVQALDIESLYFAEFFKDHPALEKTVMVTVSDLPLGKHTYADENATRSIPLASVKQLLPELLDPKFPMPVVVPTGCQLPMQNDFGKLPDVHGIVNSLGQGQ